MREELQPPVVKKTDYKKHHWYLVKVVFQIICGNGNHKPQFDEQLRLITATSPGEATEKTRQLIFAERIQFEKVVWKFIAITDIYLFTNLLDGAELFSQITETDYDLAFIKAQQLKEKTLPGRQFIPYH